MAGLKNGAELKSYDVSRAETVKQAEIPLALVERGEERVVSFHSPARELQSRLEVATGVEWQAIDLEEAHAPKHILAGLAFMSIVAIAAWAGIAKVTLALI